MRLFIASLSNQEVSELSYTFDSEVIKFDSEQITFDKE